mmetsp:Transcript_38653/g.109242  ORF Transcript_38653/g.109242 Transcript_38653/m.109242 type:complete len:234 (+) Transcript_38653:528-1229(+)
MVMKSATAFAPPTALLSLTIARSASFSLSSSLTTFGLRDSNCWPLLRRCPRFLKKPFRSVGKRQSFGATGAPSAWATSLGLCGGGGGVRPWRWSSVANLQMDNLSKSGNLSQKPKWPSAGKMSHSKRADNLRSLACSMSMKPSVRLNLGLQKPSEYTVQIEDVTSLGASLSLTCRRWWNNGIKNGRCTISNLAVPTKHLDNSGASICGRWSDMTSIKCRASSCDTGKTFGAAR